MERFEFSCPECGVVETRAIVIRVHLAEGNQSEALAEFRRYRALLETELGLEPTPRLLEVIGGLVKV